MLPTTWPGPVPTELRTAEFALRPIVIDDAALDHAAVMETREDLRLWEQSTWPADDFTVEANRDDLAEAERRHAERRALTFTVLDPAGVECLGCDDVSWLAVDAVVMFWARKSRREAGLDERLFTAVREWFDREWEFTRTVYATNEQFDQQVKLLSSTDLRIRVRFEFVEPGKPGKYLVFG